MSGELLDALERDLNVVVAPGELPTQVDRESSVFDMTVADSPDEDEDRGCAKRKTCGVDSPIGHSTVRAQHVR